MSSKAERFATRVLRGFEDASLHTDREIEAAGGPSTTTLSKYRKAAEGRLAAMPEPRGDTYDRIDQAAGWEPGSARMLWRKEVEPVPVPPGARAIVRRGGVNGLIDDLSQRVTELEERVDLIEAEQATRGA